MSVDEKESQLHKRNLENSKSLKALIDENKNLKELLKQQEESYAIKEKDTISPKVKVVTENNTNFECDKCDFSTNSLSSLVTHKSNQHNPRKAAKKSCKECDYTTYKEVNLELHKFTKHSVFTQLTQLTPQTKPNSKYDFLSWD